MASKISVVIGTYNQKDQLKATLDSILNQSLPKDQYEIIVVDSRSEDGTEAMIANAKLEIKYIVQENRGKAAARNRGIKEAQGGIILFTDADMLADPRLVEEHLLAHQKHFNASFEGLTYNLLLNGRKEPYIKQKLKPAQKLKWAYFLSGNLSVKKEAVIKAGMFDEDFSVYGWEDLELGYRLAKMNVPLLYLPDAVNYHNHYVKDDDLLKRKYNMGKSAALFYKKHPRFEIKMFLGMNPAAMAIFNYLKRRPKVLEKIAAKSVRSKFHRYILEEYHYRMGLTPTPH